MSSTGHFWLATACRVGRCFGQVRTVDQWVQIGDNALLLYIQLMPYDEYHTATGYL